ncbi:helix-turn-helix domain-containing protein [Candidatus Neomarinimicrobiota bacterium]
MGGRDSKIRDFARLLDRIDLDKMYKTKEVAALLRCSIRMVQYWVELGIIESIKVGKFIRIPGEQLYCFVKNYSDWNWREDQSD